MPVTEDASIEYAVNHPELFEKFTAFGDKQIYELTKNQSAYIWLKTNFEIPENLKNQNLGLVISYLHFADELYLNGKYIGSYGRFAPDELSNFYIAHYYGFPVETLEMQGKNTVYIKVYQQGACGISDKIILTREKEAKKIHVLMTFLRSKIYMFFEGGLFCAFILFFFLFMWIKNHSYLTFAMMNFWTIILITPFFANEVPYYTSMGIPYLFFIKVTLCCGLYFAFFYGISFTADYMGIKLSKKVSVIQHGILVFQILHTVLIKSYSNLMKITPYMLGIMFIQILYVTYKIFAEFHSSNKEIRKKARILSITLSPLWSGIALDIVLRTIFHYAELPFFSILFFQTTIIIFIYILTRNIYSVYRHEEYLNTQLQKEVEIQTQSLIDTNQKLEEEMIHSKMDLEMAAVVQQKSLPLGDRCYKGWDIDSCYMPCSVVSGDLFDLYSAGVYNEKFVGGGLFDVSGHGLPAGLITLLSRDIIERAFYDGLKVNSPVVNMMNDINETINHSKGEIDNYLTGILFKTDSIDDRDFCAVELANAGHPYPLLYSAKEKSITEVKPENSENYYGAIGIQNVKFSFSTTYFSMQPGDILLCYTDGITEAKNKDGKEFGKQRFIDFILSVAQKTSTEIVTEFEKVILSFIGDARRTDDISLLVFKRNPSLDEYIEEI